MAFASLPPTPPAPPAQIRTIGNYSPPSPGLAFYGAGALQQLQQDLQHQQQNLTSTHIVIVINK